ncbi:DUF3823 domain-containing protein [Mucilaginibacter limnophilus]|uniref:DUF3823 domain-containing protein n=1 Tax=Mucilaginibacter limnophilus TaxID=1932778 RepID=A0A3S2VK74_9SPHI|nr:DUF3823 domain-containing protein [Mucilaginibacter limnophilus]RVT97304.1 DUF3823 domain-containing protein [Mucilaginibacter limnophilus]
MKFKFHYIILMALIIMAASCKKDTFEPPQSTLKGRLVYNGQALNLEYAQVPIQLYQSGFGKKGAITGTAAQDGSYSFLLFNGDYKLIIPGAQGPFRWNQTTGDRDSLSVSVSGDQTLDLQVTPYYLIENAQYNASGRDITVNFNINKVIIDANAKDIESVALYINKTQFVSGAGDGNIANANMAGTDITSMNNVTLTATVPNLTPTQNYVFVRVGLKIAGVEDMIFSPLQKITL